MKSKYQQEYDALPQWARNLIDALKPSVGYGVADGSHIVDKHDAETHILFRNHHDALKCMNAISKACELKSALSAPYPPPSAPLREKRSVNVVEILAEGADDECAFDQPCCFGNRVDHHAVYCHNEDWPDSPRKCRRDRNEYKHEDCPGFVANPDYKCSGAHAGPRCADPECWNQ